MADPIRPSVTVITPTFSRADYLPETIESILNQNYAKLEILILDDGSDNNTREVVQERDGLKGQLESSPIRAVGGTLGSFVTSVPD